jgi:hypothetical protein
MGDGDLGRDQQFLQAQVEGLEVEIRPPSASMRP